MNLPDFWANILTTDITDGAMDLFRIQILSGQSVVKNISPPLVPAEPVETAAITSFPLQSSVLSRFVSVCSVSKTAFPGIGG